MSINNEELFQLVYGFILLIAFDLSFSHQGWEMEQDDESPNKPQYKNFLDFWLSIHMLPRLK